MIKKIVKILNLKEKGDDLAFWLSKSSQERIEAVEALRAQLNEGTPRLQRTIKIIQQK